MFSGFPPAFSLLNTEKRCPTSRKQAFHTEKRPPNKKGYATREAHPFLLGGISKAYFLNIKFLNGPG